MVEKIDTLFAKIDSGTQSLEKAKRLLEKYRQSVLKHAFEGKLTAKWREENGVGGLVNIKKLKDITDITLGQSPPSSSYNTNKDGLPFFQGKAEFGKLYPTPIKYCSEPKKRALKGDVLISVRAPVGDVNLSPGECAIGRGLASIRPNKDYILLNILLYFLQYKKNYFIGKSTGTTFQAISGDVIKNCEINLPPLSIQKKIVTKIDTLFAKVDSGARLIERTQKLLEQCRQSILKSAFEGKLIHD